MSAGSSVKTSRHARIQVTLMLAVAVIASASLGYWAGRPDSPTELSGTAYVGDRMFSVSVDGWTYGAADSVPWIDNEGSFHEDGWPACLSTVGASQRVTFGETDVMLPTGSGLREVLWVDCR